MKVDVTVKLSATEMGLLSSDPKQQLKLQANIGKALNGAGVAPVETPEGYELRFTYDDSNGG